MVIKQHTCYIVHCDHCNRPLDGGDYIPHFDEPGHADDEVRDLEWTKVRGGKHYCDSTACRLAVPDCSCVGGEDSLCDADCCPPGCPCLLHPEVPPLAPCPACGLAFANHAQRQLHDLKHGAVA
jgi:hypothetical protein